MAFPASFSTTQSGDLSHFAGSDLEESTSCATVKLSSSPTLGSNRFSSVTGPTLAPSTSHFLLFKPQAPAGGGPNQQRKRMTTDPAIAEVLNFGGKAVTIAPALPPSQSRMRANTTSRMAQSSSNRMISSTSMAGAMSSFLSRSRSKAVHPAEGDTSAFVQEANREADASMAKVGWFGRARERMRPRGNSVSSEPDIPDDQKEAYAETSAAVLETLKKVLGIAADVALHGIIITAEVLEAAPLPWLQRIATTFLSIWKAVQKVSMNRLAYLRLVQTCTNILESIYKEMEGADEQVVKELAAPIAALERAFDGFLSTVQSQVDTPFLWRYVARDETLVEIDKCNEDLLRALALFTSTIQLRTYQAVCANAKVVAETYRKLTVMAAQVAQATKGCNRDHHLDAAYGFSSSESVERELRRVSAPEFLEYVACRQKIGAGFAASPSIVSRSEDDFFHDQQPEPELIPIMEKLQAKMGQKAAMRDVEWLRSSIREVLDSGSDSALLDFLQVDKKDIPEAIKTLLRLKEKSTLGDGVENDTLHEEFVEAGIDALRRMSSKEKGFVPELPQWTITSYEVLGGPKIGSGFFSEVFQAQWNNRVVAVKVLSEVTPADLFIRETKVWKSLNHPNVLKLFGASSATGNPPWFFVSAYMKNGNLVEFLRRISRQDQADLADLGPIAERLPTSKSLGNFGKGTFKLLKIKDTYRMLHEIARGMEYLHHMGVLHGDLKAANVLVDENFRCAISDFGQSELKSEVCRITGSSMNVGTLRWKAPELLDGSCMLTPATDIYAYAIVCIEVLMMGEMPWGSISDDELRHNILEKDRRPMIPVEFTSPLLHELIAACWIRDPEKRASFSDIVCRLARLLAMARDGYDPIVTFDETWATPSIAQRSSLLVPTSPNAPPYNDDSVIYDCPDDFVALPSPQELEALRMEDNLPPFEYKMPEPTHFTVDMKIQPSQTESVSTVTATSGTASEVDLSCSVELGRRSPPPVNPKVMLARNERRYRMLLDHDFSSCLILPLWEPSSVQLGDVGYLAKPSGAFVTLFNAHKPPKAPSGSNISLPPMAGHGNVHKVNFSTDKRNVAQKGLDAFSELLMLRPRTTDPPVSRRKTYRLKSGHRCVSMYTGSAEFSYLKKADAAKAWFTANAGHILSTYGREHGIQKEDLFLVTSLLQAREYALFVSHTHPDGQAHFNVSTAPRKGQPWGTFTFDTFVPEVQKGPLYEDPEFVERDHASKVSLTGDPVKAVLLGRLRFKPDSAEPTYSK